MKRKKHNLTAIRTAALILTALIAGCFAIRFALQPGQIQQQAQEQQIALLESIRQGDGMIVIEEERDAAEVDYYDGGAVAPAEEVAVLAPLMELPASDADDSATVTVDTGVVGGIGILTIDSIDLELPVIEGVSSAQLKISVGHVPQTAAVGSTGNAVIAGHRSYTYGEHFNRLGEVAVGDEIHYLSITGEEMTFVVTEILEIVPGDQSAFDQPEDTAQLTLYTCTPIRTATHRLLVRAERAD